MLLSSIACDKCGKLYVSNCDEFVTVHGNIMRGLQGGVVGNNISDETGIVIRENHYCIHCLFKIIAPENYKTMDR